MRDRTKEPAPGIKGLTPREEKAVMKGMAADRGPDDVRYQQLKKNFADLGISVLIVGKFIMVDCDNAARIVASLNGPGKPIKKKNGTFLKLVTDNEKGDK